MKVVTKERAAKTVKKLMEKIDSLSVMEQQMLFELLRKHLEKYSK